MRFLCFSDLHRDQAAAKKLVQRARDPGIDCLIGAGDFATCRQGIADTLDILAKIQKPSVLVPGNGESMEELTAAATSWNSAHVLHGSGCQIGGFEFWGVGGGIPVTPFGPWSYDFDETAASSLLAKCPPSAVLVTHSPPFDTVDHDTNGIVRGSKAIRQAVTAVRPRLVVCGHIHSDWEREVQLGSSRIVNAGPRGVVIDIELQKC